MYRLLTYKNILIVSLMTVNLVGCSTAPTNDGSNDPIISTQPPVSHVIEDMATPEPAEIHEEIPPITVAPEPSEVVYTKMYQLPEGFVYLDDVITDATYELRYYTDHNFVGEPINGYKAPFAVGTKAMANALQAVSEDIKQQGYRIHIYDAYRPVKAVEQFIAWLKDSEDEKMKEQFYPNIDKSQLFELGYLSKKSAHSRGSTVDLTLIDDATDLTLDMGGAYDLLDERSHYATTSITKEQASNRKLLKQAMERAGFKAYSKEWWHFVLIKEPYASTYFEFDIE